MMKLTHFPYYLLLALLVTYAIPAFGNPDPVFSPTTMTRGQTVMVTVDGPEVNGATAAEVSGDHVGVIGFESAGDQVVLTLAIGARSVAGPRSITFSMGAADPYVSPDDAITINPGEAALYTLVPNAVQRGSAEPEIVVTGLNLDAITEIVIDETVVVGGFVADVDDPTRGVLSVTVSEDADTGLYDVVASTGEVTDTFSNGFEVTPGDILVESLIPTAIVRGAATEIVATGMNLDTIDTVLMGSGISVESIVAAGATSLTIYVTVSEEAVPVNTARAVTFRAGTQQFALDAALTVNSGDLAVTRIRPNVVTQGASVELNLEGVNLDGFSAFSAGDGIVVNTIDPLSPIKAIIDVTVSLDAALGFRTVAVEGLYGTQSLVEAMQVLERVEPPVTINFPDILDLGHVEVGARKRVSIAFENENDVSELVQLEIVSGDVTDFKLIDSEGQTLDERYSDRLEFTLAAFEEITIVVEFRPSLQAQFSSRMDVVVRGERYADIELRGTGAERILNYNPAPPIFLTNVEEGEIGFGQVTTLSSTAERTSIEGYEVLVEQNDSAFLEGDSLTDVIFSEPLPPEEEHLFGATLITIETEYPSGTYQGEVLIHTDRASAPLMPIGFSQVVESVVPADEDSGDLVSDAGIDAGSDMGTDVDVSGPDMTTPDIVGVDVDEDSRVGADPPSDDQEGCCSHVSHPQSSDGTILLVVGLVTGLVLLRRRDHSLDG